MKKMCLLFILSLGFAHFAEAQINEEDSITKLPYCQNRIERNFSILESHLSLIESIDWEEGNFFCYDMVLKSHKLPDFMIISVILRRFFCPGINALIIKQNHLHKIVRKSYPYKFAESTKDVELDLHFVNRRSLSRSAKRNLEEDLKQNNQKIKIRHLRRCVLLFTDYNGSWHGWIIQKNGNAFLWYYKGNTVLGLNPKDLKNDTTQYYNYSFKTFSPQGELLKN
jgi:hypothetical protein